MNQAPNKWQRGVSLIEALVALAVMSIGMLGLVSLQTSLRGSSDVAKQRSEAVRRAQQEIERWRAFTVLNTTAGSTAFADLTAGTTSVDITGTNATYTQERIVADLAAPRRGKSLTVNMSWVDRNGDTQRVRLSTAVAGIAPELAATMTVPGDGDALQQPGGRNRSIPPGAKQLGGGQSGYIPPNAIGNAVWIFNNTTGLISLCTTTASSTNDLVFDNDDTTTDNVTCGSDKAVLVSGFVRYSLDESSAPDAADAANPMSRPNDDPASNDVVVKATNTTNAQSVDCNVEHVNSGPPYYTVYYCAVPVTVIPFTTPYWTGSLSFKPTSRFTSNAASTDKDKMRACRYLATPAGYTLQSEPLANQNFLVIRAGDDSDSFHCSDAGLIAL
jgi:prepilin-type N-terminal cleavage/methylation domain-containing protein